MIADMKKEDIEIKKAQTDKLKKFVQLIEESLGPIFESNSENWVPSKTVSNQVKQAYEELMQLYVTSSLKDVLNELEERANDQGGIITRPTLAFDNLQELLFKDEFSDDSTFLNLYLHSVNELLLRLKTFFVNHSSQNEEIEAKIQQHYSNIPVDSTPLERIRLTLANHLPSNYDFQLEDSEINKISRLISLAKENILSTKEEIELLEKRIGKRKIDFSDMNQHIITNYAMPNQASHGISMWADEACKDYHMLEQYDIDNWIGIERTSQSRNPPGNEYRIMYIDMLNYIETLGYVIKKRTATCESLRVKPKYKTFTWGGINRKYSTMEDIYLYNPKCPISGTEMRLVINVYYNPNMGGEITVRTGKVFFSDLEDSGPDQMDHSTLISEFFGRWDEYESNHGLLKNHKFDSKFNEIIPRGREFSDMVISEEKKEILDDNVFSVLRNNQLLRENNIETNRGIMLAGPPGVGKSMTIDAIVSSSNSTVLFAKTEELHEDIESLFRTARKYAPTVLILEDVDALLISGQRGTNKSGAGMSGMLNCLDGVESNDGVITVATTNFPEHLDWALINRPGRFDVRIDYTYPEKTELNHILKLKLSEYKVSKDVKPEEISRQFPSPGFTGSHVHEIIKQALFICAKDVKNTEIIITQSALKKASKRMIASHELFVKERGIKLTSGRKNDSSNYTDFA